LGGALSCSKTARPALMHPALPLFVPVPEVKTTKNRLHLDLHSLDFDAAVEQALALGAKPATDVYVGDGWCVLRDPADNEFCVLEAAPPGP